MLFEVSRKPFEIPYYDLGNERKRITFHLDKNEMFPEFIHYFQNNSFKMHIRKIMNNVL